MALAEREPDVVALQEVTRTTVALWRAALGTIALPDVVCSLDDADPARQPAGRRATGVLIAARAPRAGRAAHAGPVARDRAGGARGRRPGGHDPRPQRFQRAHQGADPARHSRGVAAGPPGPRIVCGDFNVPRREHPDGTVISFRA
jgi:endonuclease/exonuclease/phosphatase family metal-dependent hydrolase